MDDNLYDEFGNYIGPDIPDMDDSLEQEQEEVEADEREESHEPITVKSI